MENTSQSQIEGLATLLVLDDETRKINNIREFGFFATNETHRLIHYHTAFLCKIKEFSRVEILAQSGAPDLDPNAPVNQFLAMKIGQIISSGQGKQIQQFNFKDPESEIKYSISEEAADIFDEMFPDHLLWCPFLNKAKDITGGMLFLRESAFSEAEIKMLRWLMATYQYTWQVVNKQHLNFSLKSLTKKPLLIAGAIITLGVLLFPVHLSVLGMGTVVPKDPAQINAPMEGVIKSFAVQPGQYVKEGQLLISMDKTDLIANEDVLEKEYFLTQAKLRTAINEAFDKKETEADIPILQSQLAIDKSKIDYTKNLIQKADIRSPINGIVIFGSKEDWLGQPVKTGEQILLVANPKEVELKIMLPIANAIQIEIGGEGEFYLYGQLKAIPIKVKTLGYNAKLTPNKILAYQLSSSFTDLKDVPQLGAQGTVRLFGYRVPFFYYIIRRPLQAVRQTFGI